MPLLIIFVLAGLLYWTVPDEREREITLKPIRETMMAAIGVRW